MRLLNKLYRRQDRRADGIGGLPGSPGPLQNVFTPLALDHICLTQNNFKKYFLKANTLDWVALFSSLSSL